MALTICDRDGVVSRVVSRRAISSFQAVDIGILSSLT